MKSFDKWDNELYHYGVKGQKWGLRRYHNADGSLTEEGKARYGVGGAATAQETASFLNRLDRQRAHANVKALEQLGKRGRGNSSMKVDQYRKTMDVTSRTINDVLQAAAKNKYLISSKPVKRRIVTGQTAAKSITASLALTTLASLSSGTSITTHQNGVTSSRFIPSLLPIVVGYTKKAQGTKFKADRDQYRKRT